MPFCLNPDCRHRISTGKPAEFLEGITHCSDCGSPLSEEAFEKIDTKETIRRITHTDLRKRIFYTIGFVLLWRVLVLIPIPGIDVKALGLVSEEISVFALGFMPYLSAYMIVEILSLFIQPLKSWRKEEYRGRVKIREVAFLATLLFALLQGYGLAQSLEGLVGSTGGKIVRHPGLSFRLISALTLTTGTFITVWIADLVTRKGVGHGISILILAGFGGHFFMDLIRIKMAAYEYSQRSSLVYFYLFILAAIGLSMLIVIVEKTYKNICVKFADGLEGYIPLKLSSAGITPEVWTSTLLMAPVTILQLIDHPISQKLSMVLVPGNIGYFIAFSAGIIFLYYFFTSFFYNPKRIVFFLGSKGASIVSSQRGKGERSIDKSLETTIPIAALYLCVVIFAPYLSVRYFHLYLGGIGLITCITILLDLMGEIRVRRKNNYLVKVAELHDIPMAGLVKSLFEQKGIPCYLRGYYHRALLYFFGPYIEISVLVPEDKLVEAREVIKNYFDEKVLIAS